VYWFGSLQGVNRGLSFDPELLYIGAMFHDLGHGEPFRMDGWQFEVGSADEAPGSCSATAYRKTASGAYGPPLLCTSRPESRSSWNPRSRWSLSLRL
jgi:hypothetical protein